MLRSMELGPRDRLSQAFVKEQEKGRTFKGAYGVTSISISAAIDRKLPFVRELCRKYVNIDPVKDLFVFIALPVFHWAHRFRYTLYDGLQLYHLNRFIAVLCYGIALAGKVIAAYTLTTFP